MQSGDAGVGDGGVGVMEEGVPLVGHRVDPLIRAAVRGRAVTWAQGRE